MGFLDHSTNNIILDAVLTDYGRQQLSLVNSSFNITHFSFGDDEVDYRMIKRYGRAVGKEKIEKNTPIFEALTNQSIALKYPLVSLEDTGASLTTSNLPYLTSNPDVISLDPNNNPSRSIVIEQKFRLASVATLNEAKLQQSYTVTLSDRFFQLLTSPSTNCVVTSPSDAIARASLGDPNRLVEYTIQTDKQSISSFSFTIQARVSTIDSTLLSIYGAQDGSGNRVITSNISIRGNTYGTTIDIPVTYTAPSNT